MDTSPRLKERPFSKYNCKTCVGNWFEERSHYKKGLYRHISLYNQDFVPKLAPQDVDKASDIAFQSAGLPMRMLFGQSEDKYLNNFTTTYDLSYNHFVEKAKKEPFERHWKCTENVWVPEQDLTEDYGNITRYGLVEYKKSLFKNEKTDPRETDKIKSEYKDSYMDLPEISYKEKRFAIPHSNSSLMNSSNIFYGKLHLRDIPLCNMTPNENLVIIPRERRRNPITWE